MFDSVDKLTVTSPAPFVNLNLDTVLQWLIYDQILSVATHVVCCFTVVLENGSALFKSSDRTTKKGTQGPQQIEYENC